MSPLLKHRGFFSQCRTKPIESNSGEKEKEKETIGARTREKRVVLTCGACVGAGGKKLAKGEHVCPHVCCIVYMHSGRTITTTKRAVTRVNEHGNKDQAKGRDTHRLSLSFSREKSSHAFFFFFWSYAMSSSPQHVWCERYVWG